jgi:hypothetical protein
MVPDSDKVGMTMTRKLDLPFLFGCQETLPPSSVAVAAVGVTRRRAGTGAGAGASASQLTPTPLGSANTAHFKSTPKQQLPPTQRKPLALALQHSAINSIESSLPVLEEDSIPLTFAPAMAASPAGGHS